MRNSDEPGHNTQPYAAPTSPDYLNTTANRNERHHRKVPRLSLPTSNTPRDPSPIDRNEEKDLRAVKAGLVQELRERFLRAKDESPVTASSLTAGRLSPTRKEPWSRRNLPEFDIIRAGGMSFRPAWQTAGEDESDIVMSKTDESENLGSAKENLEGLGEHSEEPFSGGFDAEKTLTTLSPREPHTPSPCVLPNQSPRRSSVSSIRKYETPRKPPSDATQSKQISFPMSRFPYDFAIGPWLEQNEQNHEQENYGHSLSSIRTQSSRRTSSSSVDSLGETSDTDRGQHVSAQPVSAQPVSAQPKTLQTDTSKKNLGTRIGLLKVKVILMRCAIIDHAASELECNTYGKANTRASQEYVKMHNLAKGALSIAQNLRNEGPKARCYYWMGRAYGRQRLWNDAKRAFERAEELDQVAEGNERGKGLLRSERTDIKFLERSVQKRAERADKDRKEREKWTAEIEWKTEQAGAKDEKVVHARKSPMWRPETESAIRQWMDRFDRTFECSPDLGSDSGSIMSVDRSWQEEDETLERDWAKRPLSEAELRYVEHGDGNLAPHTQERKDSDPYRPSIAIQKLRARPPNLRISSLISDTFNSAYDLGITERGTPNETDLKAEEGEDTRHYWESVRSNVNNKESKTPKTPTTPAKGKFPKSPLTPEGEKFALRHSKTSSWKIDPLKTPPPDANAP
jgi:hypothetical protein